MDNIANDSTLVAFVPVSEVSELHLIHQALTQFILRLGQANQWFNSGRERRAAIEAVNAAIDLADALPDATRNGLTQTLMAVLDALVDAERGAANPLFKPAPSFGQPTANWKRTVKVIAAAALEVKHSRGDRLDIAARSVAEALRRSGVAIPPSHGITAQRWRQVAWWREQIGRDGDKRNQARFERYVRIFETPAYSLDTAELAKVFARLPCVKDKKTT